MAREGDPNPVKGEADFGFQGQRYRFVFDWQATVAWEQATDSSLVEFLARLAFAAKGGPMPKLWHMGEFMRCGLLRHHPEVDAETGSMMFLDKAVRKVAEEATGHAMPDAGDGEGSGDTGEQGPGESYPAARSGGSRTSSGSGSKRAAKKKPSGSRQRG